MSAPRRRSASVSRPQSLELGQELQVAGLGHAGRRGERDADEPDLDGSEIEELRVSHARHRRAVGLADVRGEVGEARGAHVLEIDVRAEIELVVSGHEHVRPDHVRQLDDMGALVEARHQRGREGVAGVAEQHRHAAGALLLHDGGELGEAAAALVVAHPVDVVDEEQREGRRRRRGGSLPGRAEHGDRQAGPESEAERLASRRVRHGALS